MNTRDEELKTVVSADVGYYKRLKKYAEFYKTHRFYKYVESEPEDSDDEKIYDEQTDFENCTEIKNILCEIFYKCKSKDYRFLLFDQSKG